MRLLPRGTLACVVAAEIRPSAQPTARSVAKAAGVPVLIQPRRDSVEFKAFVDQLRHLAPNAILVDSYSMLVPAEVLALVPIAINVHGALLPAYRGPNPIQWALINGERETGVTVHDMTEIFDAGEIIAQRRVPIGFEDTWVEVRGRIAGATEALLSECLPQILSGAAQRSRQQESEARSFPRRGPDDGLIRWDQPVVDIYHLVRAVVDPLPGAFYEDGGTRHFLREWMPVAEIAGLKSRCSGSTNARGLVASLSGFRPAEGRDRTLRNSAVLCHAAIASSRAPLECGITEIDWNAGTGSLEVDASADLPVEVDRDIREALTRFAETELRLTVSPG